jgi:hypothetical protein
MLFDYTYLLNKNDEKLEVESVYLSLLRVRIVKYSEVNTLFS